MLYAIYYILYTIYYILYTIYYILYTILYYTNTIITILHHTTPLVLNVPGPRHLAPRLVIMPSVHVFLPIRRRAARLTLLVYVIIIIMRIN